MSLQPSSERQHAARPFAAVVLAAGVSSRMRGAGPSATSDGTADGIPKPLLPLGSGTIVDRVITSFMQNDAKPYVVVGHHSEEVVRSLKHSGLIIVANPGYESGMFSSVQAGVAHLNPGHSWFFVHPVDIPLVRPSTIARLMNQASDDPDCVIYPLFQGRRGHPVLIPMRLAPAVMKWHGEGGLKGLLAREDTYVEVPVPDSNIVFDVDTPDDYSELIQREGHSDLPSELECAAVMNEICHVPSNIQAHCAAVTVVALSIGRALERAGCTVDLDLVRAASSLHDVARIHPRHDEEGARVLSGFGFDRVADIVAVHTRLSGREKSLTLEAKIVFLADKLIKDTRPVSIEERYGLALKQFGSNLEVRESISREANLARGVKRELEEKLGRKLEDEVS
jgi:molybdenum cofactor cytidylyltransferase